MNAIDVIKTELACVQRDCCRVENQCAKCDLVLPVEEIISAYKKCISVLLEHEELENKIADIKANCDLAIEGRDVKIMELESKLEQAKKVKVVEHFEAFGQCRDSRRIAGLEQQIEKMKSDVTEEIGFAKNFEELHTYCILNNLLNRWENEE